MVKLSLLQVLIMYTVLINFIGVNYQILLITWFGGISINNMFTSISMKVRIVYPKSTNLK